jgi:FeS assembly SUF system regulator
MLRLGKLDDYALLIATHLSRADLQATTEEISSTLKIPKATVRKLMKLLVDGGVVTSLRGIQGGYRLAEHPSEISVYEVLQAISGPICLTECCEKPHHCDKRKSCPLPTNWQYLNEQVRNQFSSITLQDMTGELRRG